MVICDWAPLEGRGCACGQVHRDVAGLGYRKIASLMRADGHPVTNFKVRASEHRGTQVKLDSRD